MADRRATLLIADDDADLRDVIAAALGDERFRILMASDGGNALEQVQAFHPDLALLDMMMPNVDGLQFLERLRACSPPLPKVIAYSGFGGFGPIALSRGAATFIQKPFKLGHLRETIHAVLRASPVPEAAASNELLDEHDRRREALVHGADFGDASLRRDLRRLVAWAALYFGLEKSFVGLVHCNGIFVLAQSGKIDFPEDTRLDPNLSYCPDVTRAASPLIIRDTHADAPFRDQPAANSRFRFYAGAPLLTKAGVSAGAFCVRDSRAFDFNAEDMAILGHFARCVGAEIESLAVRQRLAPLFAADYVFTGDNVMVLIEGELRRAERDGTNTTVVVSDGGWSASLAAAVMRVVEPRRLALAELAGDLTVIVLGACPMPEADERLDVVLRAIAAERVPRRVGKARFRGTPTSIGPPRSFLQTAVNACRGGSSE